MKKVVYNTHLILGLLSGVVVFIVAITGCMYVFKSEIESFTQSWRAIEVESEDDLLPPSVLRKKALEILPGQSIHGIKYGGAKEAAEVVFYETNPLLYQGVIINPYNGDVIKVKNYQKDFFYIILQGHLQLWLPPRIGKPIVSTAVLLFVVVLLTGLILWWPKRNALRRSFLFKWAASWKRRLYDLHSILGFYSWIILMIIAITGLVWGFQWFSKGLYCATGGEKDLALTVPASSPGGKDLPPFQTGDAIDSVWQKMEAEYPEAASIELHIPQGEKESVYALVNPTQETYWNTEFRYFNRFTLEEMEVDHIWGKLKDATTADIIRRMNFDIHTGTIGGLPGKILAFLASLIAASLPVTGCLMWWRRRKEKSDLRKGLGL